MNCELDYFEKVHNEKMHDKLLGPDPLEEVKSATIALPKFYPDFNLVPKNVAHFYVAFPAYNGLLCTTAVFDLPVSDHGKAAANDSYSAMLLICFLYQIKISGCIFFFPSIYFKVCYGTVSE